jgi:hypothetical protein
MLMTHSTTTAMTPRTIQPVVDMMCSLCPPRAEGG